MADLDGCLKWMGKLSRTLAELDALPRKVAVSVAPTITRELQRQFKQGTDPYGRKWRRLANGKPSRLTETGKLKHGTRAGAMPGKRAGLRIIVGRMGDRGRNPIVHQTGTVNMPARKILPERGMPAAWRQAIKREMAKAVRRAAR